MVTRKMRMLAASLALVLCVSLYSVPKAKAVAVEAAAVSIGAAVLSSYLIATNMDLIGDTAETISNGITSLVSDWVTASGVADSGDSWLSALGTAAQVRNPGVLIVPGALAAGCAAFVGWLTERFGLDEAEENICLIPGTADSYFFNGVELPSFGSLDITDYPYLAIIHNNSRKFYVLCCSTLPLCYKGPSLDYGCQADSIFGTFSLSSGSWGSPAFRSATSSTTLIGSSSSYPIIWSNHNIIDVYSGTGGVVFSSSVPVPVGEDVIGSLSAVLGADFSNIANNAEESAELAIYTALPGVTLEDLAADIPAQIAAGTLAPTAELTQTGEGTNPEPGTDEDEALYPYFPVLSGIRDRLDNLGDSIVDGIMSGLKSLVVPDEAFFAEAVPALQETFQGRMGLLTFPISLLADFLGRLLDLSDQEPILRWNSVSIYGTELIAAGQYNFKDALKSAPVKQLYDIYMIAVNAILIFAFLNLCHNKYRKIMQN